MNTHGGAWRIWRSNPKPPSGGARSGEGGEQCSTRRSRALPVASVARRRGEPRLCMHIQRRCRWCRLIALTTEPVKRLSHRGREKEARSRRLQRDASRRRRTEGPSTAASRRPRRGLGSAQMLGCHGRPHHPATCVGRLHTRGAALSCGRHPRREPRRAPELPPHRTRRLQIRGSSARISHPGGPAPAGDLGGPLPSTVEGGRWEGGRVEGGA
jgi:hypothetical protein